MSKYSKEGAFVEYTANQKQQVNTKNNIASFHIPESFHLLVFFYFSQRFLINLIRDFRQKNPNVRELFSSLPTHPPPLPVKTVSKMQKLIGCAQHISRNPLRQNQANNCKIKTEKFWCGYLTGAYIHLAYRGLYIRSLMNICLYSNSSDYY